MCMRARILIWLMTISLFSSAAPCVASEPEAVTVFHPVSRQDGLHLLPVTRWIPESPSSRERIRGAVELLVGQQPGPPGGARLLRVTAAGRVVTLDFSGELADVDLGAWNELIAIQSIVHTALATAAADAVQLLIEGKTVETLAGHVSIRDPIEPDPAVLWPEFDDISGHWAARQILAASLGDVIRGGSPAVFAPAEPMARGDFITSLMAADPPFILTGRQDEGRAFGDPFPDVDPESELGRAVRMAAAAGYLRVSDYPTPQLAPDQPMTRAEAVIMVTRSAGGEERAAALAVAHGGGADSGRLGYVEAAREMNILRGYPDGSLRLDQPITRAEAVALIVRASGLCPGDGGTALVRPSQGGTLSRSEPVIGVTAREDASTVPYQLHLACGEPVSEGKVCVNEGGWFAFCPTPGAALGPAQLTVAGEGVPVVLGP